MKYVEEDGRGRVKDEDGYEVEGVDRERDSVNREKPGKRRLWWKERNRSGREVEDTGLEGHKEIYKREV